MYVIADLLPCFDKVKFEELNFCNQIFMVAKLVAK